MNHGPRYSVLRITVAAALVASCVTRLERALVPPAQMATLDHSAPYLKAHLKSGHVYVLSAWHDSAGVLIVGTGRLLDVNRALVDSGAFRLPLDSVALFETNVLRPGRAATPLSVMVGITAAIGVACATNPKACFGSCPTFYASDSSGDLLMAEGFSASIAPALEAADVDMLYRARPRGREFRLRVTNEALETHVIRWADLLVARRPLEGRVFATPEGAFLEALALNGPTRCAAPEGDCRSTVLAGDGLERFSLADSTDLAARETIDLEFDGSALPAGPVGLVVGARQSLMTTFLIYQALAWLGRDAARWLVSLETGGPAARERAGALGRALGQIEVLVPDGTGGWATAGAIGETGPLAVDTKVVPLPVTGAGPLKVRLRLTRGLWRLDYVALASLGSTVPVQRLQPERVHRAGRDAAAARDALRDSAQVLTTLPGDEYELVYRLPPEPERYELFLEARGYYLEWMRREWLAEENPARAFQLAFDPAGALRALAPAFKRMEPDMERLFWESRYVVR